MGVLACALFISLPTVLCKLVHDKGSVYIYMTVIHGPHCVTVPVQRLDTGTCTVHVCSEGGDGDDQYGGGRRGGVGVVGRLCYLSVLQQYCDDQHRRAGALGYGACLERG